MRAVRRTRLLMLSFGFLRNVGAEILCEVPAVPAGRAPAEASVLGLGSSTGPRCEARDQEVLYGHRERLVGGRGVTRAAGSGAAAHDQVAGAQASRPSRCPRGYGARRGLFDERLRQRRKELNVRRRESQHDNAMAR